MFFIYLLAFFAFDFFAFFFGKLAFTIGTDIYNVFLIFQFVFLAIFAITLIVSVCQQLNLHTTFLSLFEETRTKKRKIELYQEKYKELSVYFEKYLGNDFPAFEKEMLTAISQKPEKLLAIFQTFPELQSSFTLNKLVEKIDHLISHIYDHKIELEETYGRIRILYNSPWLLTKTNIPADIKTEF